MLRDETKIQIEGRNYFLAGRFDGGTPRRANESGSEEFGFISSGM
jgi:hypothetical protein